MRVGVFYGNFHGRGGAERLSVELALAAAELGHESVLLTENAVDRIQVEADLGFSTSQVAFTQLPSSYAAGRLLDLRKQQKWFAQWQALRELDLDVFINAQYKSEIPGPAAHNIYYAHFPHDLLQSANPIKRVYRSLTRTGLGLVSGQTGPFPASYHEIWANSEFTAEHVMSRWKRRADVLYPACAAMAPLEKESIIAVVGRFQAPAPGVPYKSQDRLIEAFAEMPDLHAAGWKLVLAGGTGNGEADRVYLEQVRSLAHGLPIVIKPDAPYSEIAQLYGKASIYWHAQGFGRDPVTEPHTQEHFGITTVEAMSAGCLPLVIGTGGPAEVVARMGEGLTWRTIAELQSLTRRWAFDVSARRERALLGLEQARKFSRDAFREGLAKRFPTG